MLEGVRSKTCLKADGWWCGGGALLVAGFALRVASCGLRVAACGLRVAGRVCVCWGGRVRVSDRASFNDGNRVPSAAGSGWGPAISLSTIRNETLNIHVVTMNKDLKRQPKRQN